MKFAGLLGASVVLLSCLMFSSFAQNAAADEGVEELWVRVKESPLKIWVDHTKPELGIVRMTRPNEWLYVLSQGESWYKVRTDEGKVGFVESKVGTPTNEKNTSIFMFLIYMVLLLGGAAGVVYFIRKQQAAIK